MKLWGCPEVPNLSKASCLGSSPSECLSRSIIIMVLQCRIVLFPSLDDHIWFSVDWIFSHDLDAEMAMEEQAANSAPAAAAAAPAAAEPGSRDGTKYKLVGTLLFSSKIPIFCHLRVFPRSNKSKDGSSRIFHHLPSLLCLPCKMRNLAFFFSSRAIPHVSAIVNCSALP